MWREGLPRKMAEQRLLSSLVETGGRHLLQHLVRYASVHQRVMTCRPSHDGKTAEPVHYCSDFRWLLILALGISIKAFIANSRISSASVGGASRTDYSYAKGGL